MLGTFLLLLTALIWGGAFLAQKLGMDHVGPFAFTIYRNVLATAFLVVVTLCRGRAPATLFTRRNLIAGFWCGFALWVPSMFQQIGITDTSPGTCAFLTANYALILPVLTLLLGRCPRWYFWPGVALALGGTYLICLKDAGAFRLGRGEMLTLVCAFFYAVQMLTVDRFVTRKDADVIGISCVQFATGAVLGIPFLALPSERAFLSADCIVAAGGAILFCGIFSSGVAYTLQNVGQRLVSPALAGILLSLESVFGVFFGWLAYRLGVLTVPEEMTVRRLSGYALVFSAIVFTQWMSVRDSRSRR